MEKVTVSSKGQIAIPKVIREALNLKEGSKLTLEVQGQTIIVSREPKWKALRGAGAAISKDFLEFRQEERRREDAGS